MSYDLTKGFNSASALKKLDYDNDVNILMGGNGISNRLSLQAFISNNRFSPEEKDKEFIEYILQLTHQQIMENIREMQKQILDAINRMNDIINLADEEITRIQEQLQNITRRHSELNDVIEAGYFDKTKDGKYNNRSIANTITAYQQRTGKELPDDLTPEMLILILRSQQEFEQNSIVPTLENGLVELHEFRDDVQCRKETFEEENERIEKALGDIYIDNSLSDEERRTKKLEILEEASPAALDAQQVAHAAETEYADLIDRLQKAKWESSNKTYLEHSDKENIEFNQSAQNELETIKPILPPIP